MTSDGCGRRRFLYRAGVTVTAGALAGCAGGNGSGRGGSGGTSPAGTGTSGETPTPAMATATDASATDTGTATEEGATTGAGTTAERQPTADSTDTRPVTEPAPTRVDQFLKDASFYDGNMVVGVSRVAVGGEGEKTGFDPAAIKVTTGTEVTWEWVSGAERHSVVALAGEDGRRPFDSSPPEVGSAITFRHTFREPGIYRYICGVHRVQGARGAVIVAPENGVGGSGSG